MNNISGNQKQQMCIPTLSALRTDKSKELKKQYIDKDPITSLYIAKSFQEFSGTIHNISYCQKNNYSRIAIDATGYTAKKLVYPDGLKSKYIFLCDIVINPKKTAIFCRINVIRWSHGAYST